MDDIDIVSMFKQGMSKEAIIQTVWNMEKRIDHKTRKTDTRKTVEKALLNNCIKTSRREPA